MNRDETEKGKRKKRKEKKKEHKRENNFCCKNYNSQFFLLSAIFDWTVQLIASFGTRKPQLTLTKPS